MIEELFADGNSFVHKTDPRCRVAVAVMLSFVIALSDKFQTLWAGLAFSLILLLTARLNLWKVMQRVFVIWGFLLFLWLILPLTFHGEKIVPIGTWGLSREGLLLCGKISLKSNAILLIFIALVTTMDFGTLGYVLNYYGIPDKLVHLLLLTYRYIFVIEQEYRRLVRTLKIRNFKAGNNLHTYQTYAYLVGMLFVRASSRAERVYQAMKCRGFHGKFHSLRKFSLSPSDQIWTAFAVVAIVGLIFMEVTDCIDVMKGVATL